MKETGKCLVIIPTLDHQDTLNYSIPSVLAQTYSNLEIAVVGDGSPPRTAEIMKEWCEHDSRIKYLPNKKGDGHGEVYRHQAILNSQADYIFYLSDDDVWLNDHISTLLEYLTVFDFVHSVHTAIDSKNRITFLEDQIALKKVRSHMINERWNFFGPTCVAHTRKAYDKLPLGWHARPDGIWSDLHMWRQWLSQPWLKCFSIPKVTTLHFPSPLRTHMSLPERVHELIEYQSKISNQDFLSDLRSQFELNPVRVSEKKEHADYQSLNNQFDSLQKEYKTLEDRNVDLQKSNKDLTEENRIQALSCLDLKQKNKKLRLKKAKLEEIKRKYRFVKKVVPFVRPIVKLRQVLKK